MMKSFNNFRRLIIIGSSVTTLLCTFYLLMNAIDIREPNDQESSQPVLDLSPETISKKLDRLKLGTYHGFPGQLNCRQICRNVYGIPEYMVSALKPVGNYTSIPSLGITLDEVKELFYSPISGGSWAYKVENDQEAEYCETVPKEGVAIVIVCNDRWEQLYVTLATLIPLLQRQHLCYRIFVVEQYEPGLLNKAKLLNIGFMEAAERFHFKCVIFHDADVAPINDLNPYACDRQTEHTVVHLGVGLDERNFTLRYSRLLGGALKLSNYHFVSVNGYSNSYWGWGQEDDDLERRLTYSRIGYIHMGLDVARYTAVPHKQQPRTYIHYHRKLLKEAHLRINIDGLNSLDYKIISVKEEELYTHIVASVGPLPSTYADIKVL